MKFNILTKKFMAKIKITLNEDHIKLLKEFKITSINDIYVGFDTFNPYGGSYIMENIAMILGNWDKAIDGTEKDYDGRKFGLELEQEMLNKHIYIIDNFEYILSIMVQYITEGVKPGTYTAINNQLIWDYKNK